jgi:hypothetical protein
MRSIPGYANNKMYAVSAMLSHFVPSKKDDDEKDNGSDNDSEKDDYEKAKDKLPDW